MGSFSLGHWLIVLVIIALVFGTSRLRNIGSDLGDAVNGFKKAARESDELTRQRESESNQTSLHRER